MLESASWGGVCLVWEGAIWSAWSGGCLPRPGGLLRGEWCLPGPGGLPGLGEGGGICSGGVPGPGGCLLQGGMVPAPGGGLPGPGGCLPGPGVVSAWSGGVYPSMH